MNKYRFTIHWPDGQTIFEEHETEDPEAKRFERECQLFDRDSSERHPPGTPYVEFEKLED